MAITMQGSWTVSVKAKNAAFAQQFVISGAVTGNGTYTGAVGTSVFVTGAQWSINIQNQSPGHPWADSRQRIGFPVVSGGIVRLDINSDDAGGDLDFNDLVLTCSVPVSASEFIVYGHAKTYSGRCWNPCYRRYYAIETEAALTAALANPALRAIIQKLYPERVPKKPVPGPDPARRFRSLLLPTGAPVEISGLAFHSAASQAPVPEGPIANEKDAQKFQTAAVTKLRGAARPVTFDGAPVAAGAAKLSREEQLVLADISDKYRLYPICNIQSAPGLLLRFQEYDRTAAEKLGASYDGAGPRENLGLTATDELGNYIFRFSRSFSDIANETLDVGAGELLSAQIFPDVIAQVLGTGMAVDFETPPHYNVPNLVRIDLCIPFGVAHPSTGSCEHFDRTITRIGDIIVLHSALSGHPNTLDSDGRITSRNADGPIVDCAAWRNVPGSGRNGLSVYACFGPSVVWYTMRYKRRSVDADWRFVDEPFKLNHIPEFAIGYTGTLVGSFPVSVHVDGGAAVTRPAYANHQGQSDWIENDLKLILNSALYADDTGHGPVDFAIQGYDAAGIRVAGSDDVITLYIDNNPTTLSIHNVNTGAMAPNDCALLSLPSAASPLTVQYRVDNPEGFLHSWGLSVTRGNNYALPVTAGGVVPQGYPPAAPAVACNFHGSADYPVDMAGFTETTLQPAVHVDPLTDDPTGTPNSNWLPAGKTFCAFAFTLSATDRVTDGRAQYQAVSPWQDLVGLSFP